MELAKRLNNFVPTMGDQRYAPVFTRLWTPHPEDRKRICYDYQKAITLIPGLPEEEKEELRTEIIRLIKREKKAAGYLISEPGGHHVRPQRAAKALVELLDLI